MHFNNTNKKKVFFFELFKKKVAMVISANEIKRDCRLLLARFITIIMNAHDDSDEVNDKTANDDDESSLSLDQRFVHIGMHE